MLLEHYIDQLAAALPERAREHFGPLTRMALERAMKMCGMFELPPITGDPQGQYASCLCICETCHQPYGRHPLDWRQVDHGHRPCLHILCDGTRVKL